MTVRLIVNEFAINAAKYAFPVGDGRIVLGFHRKDGGAALTVTDDEIGLDASSGSSSALGSRFVEALVRQLDGTLATASGKGGTTVTVRLPASVLAER